MSDANAELVDSGDIDELLRRADQLSEAARWAELVDLAERCRADAGPGAKLAPAASRCDYRLALDAPGVWAARVLVPGTGRFAPGPIPEIAASTHAWEDLAPHVVQGAPDAAIAAHERVVRGEDLHGDRRLDPFVLEVPLRLSPWEPRYPVATYAADDAHFPCPALVGFEDADIGPARPAEDSDTLRALVQLAAAWTTESNGRAESVAVHGDAAAAVGALGPREARMARLTPAEGLAWMAWTAASGGAHGRRRGMAAGRFAAWWAATALTGMLEDFPPEPGELGDAIGELQWWAWDAGRPDTGWTCRLAIEDPADGLAWALDASDAATAPERSAPRAAPE